MVGSPGHEGAVAEAGLVGEEPAVVPPAAVAALGVSGDGDGDGDGDGLVVVVEVGVVVVVLVMVLRPSSKWW